MLKTDHTPNSGYTSGRQAPFLTSHEQNPCSWWRWSRHRARVSARKSRSAGIAVAGRTERPLSTRPWCQRRNNLGSKRQRKKMAASVSVSGVFISIPSSHLDTNIPTHLSASSSKKESDGGGVHCLVWIFRMSFLACRKKKTINKRPKYHPVNFFHTKRVLRLLTHLSGRPKRNSLSKRPGLLSAGSIESSRFVAPMTTTSPLESNPSISASRVDTMELWKQKIVFFPPHTIFSSLVCHLQSFRVCAAYLWIWSWRLDLTGAKPSISSKKMMDGRIWYACEQSHGHLIKINSIPLRNAVCFN